MFMIVKNLRSEASNNRFVPPNILPGNFSNEMKNITLMSLQLYIILFVITYI